MTRELYLPPPTLTVSEWADGYRYLSSEASAEPGKWHTSRAPYQKAMMDAVKENERVVIMTAAQVGKSEVLLNTLGYFVHYDPCPILMVQPTLEMGEAFSKEKIAPMIRDTPALSRLIEQKARTRDNNIRYKHFSNSAILSITGANSPAGLASRSVRVLLCDEVDRYPESAGKEGDPLSIAMKRTSTFWNRHIVMVSTPTMKGISRIYPEFESSTRDEWMTHCPTCGAAQPYTFDAMLWRDRTIPVMRCASCGAEHDEHTWKVQPHEWMSQAASDVRGFHLNAFASVWKTWPELVRDYSEAYNTGPERLQTWINTVLGEPYENAEGVIEVESINENCEPYEAEVPDDVLVLTCGVDTQDDRLELEVVGWGLGGQSWGIEYKIIYGNTGTADVWNDLDAYLSREFKKANGEGMIISCTCIDSAGHSTEQVYKFCLPRLKRRIFPIVGRGQWGTPSVRKPTRNNRYRIPLFTLGVGTIKGTLHARLKAQKGEPGYCHFPKDPKRGYDEVYFAGLLSERMVVRRTRGRETVRWELRSDKTRNEPLDCRVYAMGAFEILDPDLRKHALGMVKAVKPVITEKQSAPVARKRRVVRRGLSW